MALPRFMGPRQGASVLLFSVLLSRELSIEAAVLSQPKGIISDAASRAVSAEDTGMHVAQEVIAGHNANDVSLDFISSMPMSKVAPLDIQGVVTNKWKVYMANKQQQVLWSGTFVYACFSVLCASFYYQARLHYPKMFHPLARTEVFPSTSVFSFALLDMSDPNLCVVGCCCPWLRWADTMDRHGYMSYWKAFFATFCFMLLLITVCESIYDVPYIAVAIYISNALLGVFYRQKLRDHFLKESGTFKSLVKDCYAWFLCQPCAIIQEAREHAIQETGGDATELSSV